MMPTFWPSISRSSPWESWGSKRHSRSRPSDKEGCALSLNNEEDFRMLVLSRKTTEAVVITQYDIVLPILDVKKDQVRLGIAAPQDVRLYRRGLWEAIQQQHDQPVEKVVQRMPTPPPTTVVIAP